MTKIKNEKQPAFTKKRSDMLSAWQEAGDLLAAYKGKEMTLRKQLVQDFFPSPVEGVNTYCMPAGYLLKLTHKIERKIDEAALSDVLEQMEEGTEDTLVKYKPSLNKKAYDLLPTDEQTIFLEALIIKPGTPSMTIIAPKVLPKV